MFLLRGSAITWQSSKQPIITRSAMDAELVALDSYCLEVEWLWNLMSYLHMAQNSTPPISINYNDKSVIKFSKRKFANIKYGRHIKLDKSL